MATTTIYVVTVTQTEGDYTESQVVASFKTEKCAHDFITNLENIVHEHHDNDVSISDINLTYQTTVNQLALDKLVAIHPRAVVYDRRSYLNYTCEKCELTDEPESAATTVYIVTVVQGRYFSETRIVSSFLTEEDAYEFIKRLDDAIDVNDVFKDTIQKLAAIHPRAVIKPDDNYPKYTEYNNYPEYYCAECDLL